MLEECEERLKQKARRRQVIYAEYFNMIHTALLFLFNTELDVSYATYIFESFENYLYRNY